MGRRIIVNNGGNGGNGGSQNDGNNNTSRSTVPLSLWPTIIKRAQEKSEEVYYAPTKLDTETITKNATGIYYLLHGGPILMPDLLYSRSGLRCNGDDGNDDRSKNNTNDGGGKKSNTVSSLKRKRAIH